MDQLFIDLIGKPKLNPAGKIITIIADNFSLLDDQAKFLKASLAIPAEKQLPLNEISKSLIQIGSLHKEIQDHLEKANWVIRRYDTRPINHDNETICGRIEKDISQNGDRSLIFINDASRLQLVVGDRLKLRKFTRTVDRWRRVENHFVVVLYQQSRPQSTDTFLRDLEYISDACVRVKSHKSCYLMSSWFQPIPIIKTLIPPKVETKYYTCKVGKSFWSADLLCFYELHKVSKNFDPDLNDSIISATASKPDKKDAMNEKEDDGPESALQRLGLDGGGSDDEDRNKDPNSSTLPYIRAQDPAQSRIFYYPDKDDDVDEDDPDDDLGI